MWVVSSILIFLFLAPCWCPGQGLEQNSAAKPITVEEYHLSPTALAAGIDGRLAIGLTINESGKASDVRIYGGPMWPCGSSMPESEIDKVKKSVKEHVLEMKFSPELKDGKARSVSAEITFMLSERIKGAANIPGRLFRPSMAEPGLVDVGQIERRAESLRRPSRVVRFRGVIIVQILVDENGKVTHAGVYKGSPESSARDAACESKFKPATVKGKPVPMTGMLTYIFQ
jgi:hypothetical protein